MGGRYAEGSTIKIYVTVLYAVFTQGSHLKIQFSKCILLKDPWLSQHLDFNTQNIIGLSKIFYIYSLSLIMSQIHNETKMTIEFKLGSIY